MKINVHFYIVILLYGMEVSMHKANLLACAGEDNHSNNVADKSTLPTAAIINFVAKKAKVHIPSIDIIAALHNPSGALVRNNSGKTFTLYEKWGAKDMLDHARTFNFISGAAFISNVLKVMPSSNPIIQTRSEFLLPKF